MPSARLSRTRRFAHPSALWAWGVIATSCVYPELSTSPDFAGGGTAGASSNGGEGAAGGDDAGGGGSGGGGQPNEGGGDDGGGGNEAGSPPVSGSGGEGGAVEPDTSIRATVVDANGEPLAGVPVLIDELQLESDANGQVVVPGEGRSSFRATVINPEAKSAYAYDGITRREPYLVLPSGVITETDAMGTLSGTIGGLQASEQNLAVTFETDDGSIYYGIRNPTDIAPSVGYELTAVWSGGTLEGSVMALNWASTPPAHFPSAYYFGSKDATLAPDDIVAGFDFSLSPLSTRELSVTIGAPPGVTRNDFLLLGPFNISVLSPPGGTLTYQIPDDADFPVAEERIQFVSTCTFGEVGGANSSFFLPITSDVSAIAEECPTPPSLTSPADEAVGVRRTTPLVFEPAQSGCHGIMANYVAQSWNVYVWTVESEVVLPDLAAWGLDYSAQAVDWTASTSAPCESIDEYVRRPGSTTAQSGTSTFARSDARRFKTVP